MRIVSGVAGGLLVALSMSACASRPQRVAAPSDEPGWRPHPVATERTGSSGTVAVTVVHPDGAPVAAAKLRLYRERDGRMSRLRETATTDGLGRAVLEADGPGTYRVALEESPGVAKGWLLRHFVWHAVDVVVSERERAGHAARLIAPRSGMLEVRASRDGLPPDVPLSVSLRHRTPMGDLQSAHSMDYPEPVLDASGSVETRRYEGLPEGRYMVRVGAPETRRCRLYEVSVAPGDTTILVAAPGPPGPRLAIEYDGPPSSERSGGHQYVWLNPYDGSAEFVRGPVQPKPHVSRSAAPGRFVAILPDLHAAMAVDLGAVGRDEGWRVRLRPPDWVTPASGGVTLSVRVVRGHDRLTGAFVALALPSTRHLQSGEWMRTHTGGRTHFENVPPGDWDIVVVDGVYEQIAGLPALTVRRVRVGDGDLNVTIQVPAP